MPKSHKAHPTGAAALPADHIAQSILFLRGQRVILDRELATIYDVETRTLNQAIKRNRERFPEDFMFQLNPEEAERSRSQSVILNAGRGKNIKYLPYAFTFEYNELTVFSWQISQAEWIMLISQIVLPTSTIVALRHKRR